MEERALRPGTPSAAPVMALGMPELPVTPVCTHSPIIPVTPFSHSYEMCLLNMEKLDNFTLALPCYSDQQGAMI